MLNVVKLHLAFFLPEIINILVYTDKNELTFLFAIYFKTLFCGVFDLELSDSIVLSLT